MQATLSNRRFQLLLNGGLGVVALAAGAFGTRHFMRGGWPLHHADPLLVGAAALLLLVAYPFKAWG